MNRRAERRFYTHEDWSVAAESALQMTRFSVTLPRKGAVCGTVTSSTCRRQVPGAADAPHRNTRALSAGQHSRPEGHTYRRGGSLRHHELTRFASVSYLGTEAIKAVHRDRRPEHACRSGTAKRYPVQPGRTRANKRDPLLSASRHAEASRITPVGTSYKVTTVGSVCCDHAAS
jgi:hypothetical protein